MATSVVTALTERVFFSGVPFDWIIVIAGILLFSFVSVIGGTRHGVAAAIAMSLGPLFLSLVPKTYLLENMTTSGSFHEPLALLIIVTILFLFLIRILPNDVVGADAFAAIACGIACTAIGVIMWISIPALQTVWSFGPHVQAVFAEQYRFWWFLGSFALLAIARL